MLPRYRSFLGTVASLLYAALRCVCVITRALMKYVTSRKAIVKLRVVVVTWRHKLSMVTELLCSTTVGSTVYCADTNALCSYATAQLCYSTYSFFALYCNSVADQPSYYCSRLSFFSQFRCGWLWSHHWWIPLPQPSDTLVWLLIMYYSLCILQ